MAGSDPKRWSSGSAELSAWRSVSFDLDGTFADTSTDLADALNTLRLELGRQALPVPDVARHVGRGARWLVANCIDGGADDAIDELVLRFDEPLRAIAPGQAAVLYDVKDPERVVGGGWIRQALNEEQVSEGAVPCPA